MTHVIFPLELGYEAAICIVLPHHCRALSIRIDETGDFPIFTYRLLQGITGVWREHWIRYVVSRWVLVVALQPGQLLYNAFGDLDVCLFIVHRFMEIFSVLCKTKKRRGD